MARAFITRVDYRCAVVSPILVITTLYLYVDMFDELL